jgi:hypothetical protein
MGTLYILEGETASHRGNLSYPLHRVQPSVGLNASTLAISGTSASHTLDDQSRFVTLIADQDMHIAIGTGSATATTSDFLIPAYTVFSLDFEDGTNRVIAAIEA